MKSLLSSPDIFNYLITISPVAMAKFELMPLAQRFWILTASLISKAPPHLKVNYNMIAAGVDRGSRTEGSLEHTSI